VFGQVTGNKVTWFNSGTLTQLTRVNEFVDSRFWPTVLSVTPVAHRFVCLSSVCLSVAFCIVVKWYVLAKNCLKERIGNQGQKVDCFGYRHISTSGYASTATKTAVFALFFARTAQ